MSDVQDTTAAKKDRKTVSKRDFIDVNGATVDKIEEATGARYTLLRGNEDGTDRNFDVQVGEAGKLASMAAIFGLHTKIGNVANTVLNDATEPGTPVDAAAAVAEWLAQVDGGVWAERAGGIGGQRIDKDALAGAIVAVLIAAGKATQEQADALYADKRQRLEEDAAYVRSSRQVTEVAAEYARRVGKGQKTVDDL